MATERYRAGIIGLGFIGAADQVSGDALGQLVGDLDGTHLQALSNHPQVDLVAGSSRDSGRRARFAERTGAVTYSDWREMLSSEPFDIVSVATYAPQHAEMVVAAAEHGARAIYCEKPMAVNLVDAEQMVAACRQAGSLLAINHNRRFNPNYRRLRDLISQGGLGELTSANLQWGSGRLGNVGTHFIDAIRMLTGREVEAVSATLDTAGKADCRGSAFRDPGGWGMMRLQGGLMVTVDAADFANVPPTIIINGTQGRALVGGEEIVIEPLDGEPSRWQALCPKGSSMDYAVGEIVDWLGRGGAFCYPGEEALKTHEAITGFHASHVRNASFTELPLSGTDRDIEVRSG